MDGWHLKSYCITDFRNHATFGDCFRLENSSLPSFCGVMDRFKRSTDTRVTIKSVGRLSSEIRCMAKLDGNFYVLCHNPNDGCSIIRVFEDRNEFRRVKEISLDVVTDGEQLKCCQNLKCLYLYDSNEKFIWIIKLNDPFTVDFHFYKWLYIVDIEIQISVSRNDHLWVLYYNTSPCNMEIYDGTNATLFKSIEFADDIGTVKCVIENQNDQFIILHCLRDSKETWIISQLNSNMEVTHRFEPYLRSQKLNYVRSMCLDSLKNLLIVTDDTKLHLIDADSFNSVKTLMYPGDFKYKIPVWYDARKSQMIMYRFDGVIEIFELS